MESGYAALIMAMRYVLPLSTLIIEELVMVDMIIIWLRSLTNYELD